MRWWAMVAALVACTGGETTPVAGSSAGEAVEAGAPASGGTVVLRAVAGAGQVPGEIAIRLPRPLFPAGRVGLDAPEGTVLAVDPPVAGRLVVRARDALAFVPDTGFAPDTRYRLRLEAVADGEGTTLRPEAGAPWSLDLETPPLRLLRLALRDRAEGRIEVGAVFSAAVEPEAVAARARFLLDGAPVAARDWRAGARGNEVIATLAGGGLAGGGRGGDARLELDLRAGVPWAFDDAWKAPAGTAALDLAAGRPVRVVAASVREGARGFYVDVFCTDEAAGGERWVWDPDSYDGYTLSERCLLTDEAADRAVHLSPATAVSVAEGQGGFRIFGDIAPGTLHLRIDAGATTVDGGVLGETFEADFEVPHRSPALAFATRGRYVPRAAWRRLAVEHRNVEAATLTVRRVPPENLAWWIAGDEAADERDSDLVHRGSIRLDGPPDEDATTWIDLAGRVPDLGPGVYEIRLSAEEEGVEVTAATRLLRTDLELVAKRERAEGGPAVRAWALSAEDGGPLPGVELRLVRPSGTAVATCRTDAEGGCLLRPRPGDPDDTPPIAVIARKGDDLSYLAFDEVRVRPELRPGEAGGRPWGDAATPYLAAAWTDRGVYRPGETAHVAVLVRDGEGRSAGAGLPVVLSLYDPRERELRRVVAETDAVGLVAHDFDFADFATTGRYRVEARVADAVVGAARFSVEEFVPERMAVEATVVGAEAGFVAGDPVPVALSARWLFGGVPAGARFEVDCALEPGTFTPPGREGWHFGRAEGLAPPVRRLDLGAVTGRLDDEGRGRVSCPPPARAGAWPGSSRLVATALVFEGESGRSTRARAEAPVFAAPFHLGTRASTDTARPGQEVTVEGIVVDHRGEPATAAPERVRVRIDRLEQEFGWWWADDERQERALRRVREETREVPVTDGRFTVRFTPREHADGYLVTVSAGGASTEQYLAGTGGGWWWGPEGEVDATPRPERPVPLVLEVPESVRPGEAITVRTTAPWPGRILWAAETDRVVAHAWRRVEAGPASWSVTLDEAVPNVHLTALLVKDPRAESPDARFYGRAFGTRSVRVEPVDRVLDLRLAVPGEIRPWSTLEVGLSVAGDAGGPVAATVAAVDEGVLQLTGFASPDPLAQVFARRAPGVETFETFGWTLVGASGGSRTGGDLATGVGRVQAVRPVALWSGVVRLDEDGRGTVRLDVPGFRGRLRVMAVAASPERLGAAEAAVVVRDPITLQATLPRFLVSGDIAQVPVMLTNTTDRPRSVRVALEVTDLDAGPGVAAGEAGPAVRFLGEDEGRVELAPGASATVAFQVTAARAPAAARFRVVAEAGTLRSEETLELPLLPSRSEVRRIDTVRLDGDRVAVPPPGDDWLPGSDRATMWVSGDPHAAVFGHVGRLLRYPYGCVEQTTSATRPLLALSGVAGLLAPGIAGAPDPDALVRAGLDRVLSMQTPSGGFAYWPGGTRPTRFGTAYAVHLLLDAREAGFDVPAGPLAEAVDWLARDLGTTTGAPDTATAYEHYVLARAGRGRAATVAGLLDRLAAAPVPDSRWERLAREEATWLLKAAARQAGDHRYEADLKRLDGGAIRLHRDHGWTFFSDLRFRALRLAIFGELFGADPAGADEADRVAEALGRLPSRGYTTQELAWGVAALARRAGTTGPGDFRLRVDGRPAEPLAVPGVTGWVVRRATLARSLAVERDGGAADRPAWLVRVVRGVPAHPAEAVVARGVAVDRAVVAADGRPLDLGRHAIGDAAYVVVRVENRTGGDLPNLALVDRLPAGWEIENPRLGRGELPAFADALDRWEPDHMNLRDDRVEVLGGLGAGETRFFVYAVRAVTAGTFTWPGVRLEAMYDPEIEAARPGEVITIAGPWEGFLL